MLMTMRELAKLANVSVSTVSKAFCDADDVSAETKAHIFEIAKQQGCYGKYYKGKYHKKIIAIICPELASHYYAAFVEKLQALIEGADGLCVISADGFSRAKQAELIEYYASYLKVDGLIVFGLKSRLKKGCETPIVSLFSSADRNVDSVDIDMQAAIHDAVETLSRYGHRRIAFLGERLTVQKAEHFAAAMAAAGNKEMQIVESGERFEKAGEDGVSRLLPALKRGEVTAIVCAYDNIAFGAIRRLKKSGLTVPGDVSVIGIDNVPTSGYTETSLTSIDTAPDTVCRIAWELLQKKIESPYFKAKQNILIRPNLIVRESIRRIDA